MTATVFELAMALGVPSLTVLVGILLNHYGIGRLDRRMDKLDGRIDKLESRMESMDKESRDRLQQSEQEAARRNERILDFLRKIQLDMREFYRTIGQHDIRLDNLEKS